MTVARHDSQQEPVLVLAPHGRDAQIVARVLEQGGVAAAICPDITALAAALDHCAAVILTDEALTSVDAAPLLDWVSGQPPWSDLPFIVLANKGVMLRRDRRAVPLDRLGNAVLMERPLNADSLASAGVSAIRARRRQLSMRDLAETLETRVQQRTHALAETESRFRAVFEGFPESLFVVAVTPDGHAFEGFNPAGERRTGFSNPEISGKPAAAFLQADEAKAVSSALRRCVFDGVSLNHTMDFEFPAGSGTFDTTLTPMHDASGAVVRVLGIARDVTARNRLEARLRQSQKLEAVGQLTGGVAHDFNNLLQVVLSGLTLLERTNDPVRRTRLADSVRRAAERGGELTKRLLTFARRQSLRPEPVDLATWLNDGAGEILGRTLRGDIETELLVPADLPPVDVDPAELELAVLNLAVNGRDAMPSGGTLTVAAQLTMLDGSAEADGLSGRFVRLSVSDTGMGMSEELQARVFEPFFTTKEVGKGTGLGLAQVYGFAKQSGGGVRMVSHPGHGTTVSMLLPVSTRGPARPATVAKPAPQGAIRAAAVLVVEDDEEVAALVVDMLTQLGHQPTLVTTAAAALGALADSRAVDLLFSDVMMPGGMNGLVLAREARRRRPGLAVLLTTGYTGTPGGDLPADLPMLRKPYQIDDLRQALSAVITPQSSPRQPAEPPPS